MQNIHEITAHICTFDLENKQKELWRTLIANNLDTEINIEIPLAAFDLHQTVNWHGI